MTDLPGVHARPFHVRQGDVLIVAIDVIPPDATVLPREGDRVVLAYGERSGNAHVVVGGQSALLQRADDEDRYLRVETPSEVEHEEHGPIALAAGVYRVIYQRVYEPAIETLWRRGLD